MATCTLKGLDGGFLASRFFLSIVHFNILLYLLPGSGIINSLAIPYMPIPKGFLLNIMSKSFTIVPEWFSISSLIPRYLPDPLPAIVKDALTYSPLFPFCPFAADETTSLRLGLAKSRV
jgi:hypothetical protein